MVTVMWGLCMKEKCERGEENDFGREGERLELTAWFVFLLIRSCWLSWEVVGAKLEADGGARKERKTWRSLIQKMVVGGSQAGRIFEASIGVD